jgi:hypothetical protein
MFVVLCNHQILNNPQWHLSGAKLFSTTAAQFCLKDKNTTTSGSITSIRSTWIGASGQAATRILEAL